MIGEELVSKNGKWIFMLDPETADIVLFDRKGNEIKRSAACDFLKPLIPNIHLLVNEYMGYYQYIENGESKNMYCFYGIAVGCEKKEDQCYLKLDNDGHLKFFKPSGEPYYNFY